MTPASPRQRKLAIVAWILVCLIWGTTYLGIRISLETIPPWLMSGLRWTIAGSLLAGYLIARGERLPAPRMWGGIAVLGFLLLVLGNGGVVWAEQYVPSGLTAVIVAASPFWMAGVEALRSDGERLTARAGAGLLVGFAGILLLVWSDLMAGGAAGRGFIAGVASLQIACAGWALGSSYSRRHARHENVLGTTAAQMLVGGVMMSTIGLARGEWSALHVTTRTGLALGYLATIGAIGGFVSYTYALRHLPVSFVSLYAYINPIIAVALGFVLLGEPFTPRMAIAAGLVFAGVTIVRATGGRADSERRAAVGGRPSSSASGAAA
jgi:drug/metabolite transporter (DMT)-like permease